MYKPPTGTKFSRYRTSGTAVLHVIVLSIVHVVQGSVDWKARKRATDDSALCACGASGDSRYNILIVPELLVRANYTNKIVASICLRVLKCWFTVY